VNVFIQPSARADILNQYQHYVEQGVPDVAERFVLAVMEAADTIGNLPDAGAPKILRNPKLSGLRSWPVNGFDAFRIFYLVRADTLNILRILHTRRDISSILEDQTDDL